MYERTNEFINLCKKETEFLVTEYNFTGPIILSDYGGEIYYSKEDLGIGFNFDYKDLLIDMIFYNAKIYTEGNPSYEDSLYPYQFFQKNGIQCNYKKLCETFQSTGNSMRDSLFVNITLLKECADVLLKNPHFEK